ncbi:MAG TPA: hypothetical protein VK717_12360 [Opitutaceae bacterium]|jgi:hypothetical protein|nr:hypothetical protein [Opitutaceae bacterium]
MKSKESASTKNPDPTHLEWLVENRAANQLVSVKLYKSLNEHPDQFKNKEFGIDAQMLIAVSFSLWRSAFLSDKTGYLEDTNEGAEWFLGEMLLNNAITYVQDRKAKDWTFNYYASNARYRLDEYSERHPDFDIDQFFVPKQKRTPKIRWKNLHNAFEKAVEHFGGRLKRAAKNSD